MGRKEIIFSILLTVTCIFLIVFLVRKNIEPHAYMGDFPPNNYQNKSSREKEHHDIHTAWGDMGYYPNKRNEYEYDGSDSLRTSENVKAEAERIRVQSEIAQMKSKAERLHLKSIEAEKTRSKIEQEKYAAEADLKLSVINLSAALNELRQSSGSEIELARAYAEEMNEENNKLKQKLAEAAAAEAEADKAAAEAARLEAEAAENLRLEKDAAAKAQEEADAAAKAQEEADAAAKAQEKAAPVGTPIQCNANDVGSGVNLAVYRYTGGTELRHYPNPSIASSWDPDWGSTLKKIDCLGLTQGEKMPMNPTPLPNGIYSLKGGRSGKNCADEGNRIVCDRGHVRGWEKFTFEKHGDKYALKGGRNGKYCADKGSGIVCDQDEVDTDEKFTIEKHGDQYSLKGGRSGKYCADEDNNKRIICNRGHVQSWEKFTISPV